VCSLSKRARTEGYCTDDNSLVLNADAVELQSPVIAVIGGASSLPDTAVGSNVNTRKMASQYDAVRQTPPVAVTAHSVNTGAYRGSYSTSSSRASSVTSTATDSYCTTATMASVVDVLSSAADAASSSGSILHVDDMPVDVHVTRSLAELMLSTKAGDYTENNRSQQARSIVHEWNASNHDDVAVKLALLRCWHKCGHIDESFRSEQVKLAWGSYVHCKLA
jgi:peptidoglycan DL-endopeptidase CwlO